MLALALPCFCGCGSSGPEKYTVSGTVTFDGQPVADGEIIFSAEAGGKGTDGGKIVNGQYTLQALPGKKVVRVMAMREVPGKFDESNPGEKVPFKEMYIPDKYSGRSELKAEITAGGKNQFDFPLTSK
jgi:hypothetical protein